MVVSAAAALAAAYVPPHMELPAGWTDVSVGTVSRSSKWAMHLQRQ